MFVSKTYIVSLLSEKVVSEKKQISSKFEQFAPLTYFQCNLN